MTPSRLTPAPEITPIADVYPGCDPGVWQSIGAPSFNLDMTSNSLFWIQESEALAQQWSAAGIHAPTLHKWDRISGWR